MTLTKLSMDSEHKFEISEEFQFHIYINSPRRELFKGGALSIGKLIEERAPPIKVTKDKVTKVQSDQR